MSLNPDSLRRAECFLRPSAEHARGDDFDIIASLPTRAVRKENQESKFLQMHLNKLPTEVKKAINTPEVRALLKAVTSCKAEVDMHKPIVALLNHISSIICDYLNDENADDDKDASGDKNADVDVNIANGTDTSSGLDTSSSTDTRCGADYTYRTSTQGRMNTRSRTMALAAANDLSGTAPVGTSKTPLAASRKIPRKTRKKTKAPAQLLTFLDHHAGPTAYHPQNRGDQPDLIAVWGVPSTYVKYRNGGKDSYLNVPSYKVVSIAELKPKRGQGSGASQTISYLWDFRTARPDMPGVYALYANLNGYQIIWADAEGAISSLQVDWKKCKLELLFAYVYSMYKPPRGHHLFDPTMRASRCPVDGVEVEKEMTYTITIPDSAGKGGKNRVYRNCVPIHWGPTFGRRTTVFLSQDKKNPDDVTVIKDSYSDDRRLPGVVRLRNEDGKVHVLVDGEPISTAYRGEDVKEHRTLDRLEMRSYGQSFARAESLLDLLKATYDVLEAHRYLVLDTGVLHRDLSIYNVLMYPKHGKGKDKNEIFVEDPPRFIEEVLNYKSGRANDHPFRDQCRALLIDLDNGSELTDEAGKELTFKTGTPRYISRAVAQQGLLTTETAKTYAKMPVLAGKAFAVYVIAYGEETYERHNDGLDTFHGSHLPEDAPRSNDTLVNPPKQGPPKDRKALLLWADQQDAAGTALTEPPEASVTSKPFCHRMDHDAESMFWVLFRCLLCAQPRDVPVEEDTNSNTDAWQLFTRHTISKKPGDSRAVIMGWTEDEFRAALHPKLAHVASLLRKLVLQVRPEYGYLDPPPPQEHLHEAMRRLLLEAIVHIQHDSNLNVALDPDRKCPLSKAEHDAMPAPRTKRKAEFEDNVDYLKGSKRPHSECTVSRSISYAPDA
ncbi:hypothetical protein K474DRAFT_1675708 [Panus rudis PR-1116 ss-1]|nr:hypothetical protein K474DRAFT_1675708 [Panus rudis PR-1116 ss-1]